MSSAYYCGIESFDEYCAYENRVDWKRSWREMRNQHQHLGSGGDTRWKLSFLHVCVRVCVHVSLYVCFEKVGAERTRRRVAPNIRMKTHAWLIKLPVNSGAHLNKSCVAYGSVTSRRNGAHQQKIVGFLAPRYFVLRQKSDHNRRCEPYTHTKTHTHTHTHTQVSHGIQCNMFTYECFIS